MYPSNDWINKSSYKAKQVLEEAKESMLLTLPIPITKVAKLYVPNIKIATSTNPDIINAVSACATRDMRDGWFVLINGTEPLRRQRFSLAHELGHIILMTNPASTVYCGKGNDWEERLCNIFAGKLLVPDDFLLNYCEFKPLPYLEDVVVAFQVSPEVAHIRMQELNLEYVTRFKYPFIHK